MKKHCIVFLIFFATFAANYSYGYTVLYDATLNGGNQTPDLQGFDIYKKDINVNPLYAPSAADGLFTLKTYGGSGKAEDYSFGYQTHNKLTDQVIHPLMEGTTLDRYQPGGFSLFFRLRIADEYSWPNQNRAGFSVLLISSDLHGIQLNFWEDKVWVFNSNNGQVAQSYTTNTTSALKDYELNFEGDIYRLFINGTQRLTGSIYDFAVTNPESQTTYPNNILFGDITKLGYSTTQIVYFAIEGETREQVVPEPMTICLFLIALGSLKFRKRLNCY